MKNLFILRNISAILKKEIEIEKAKYDSFISSEDTLATITALDGVDFKEFVINNDKYKKDNKIYKINNYEEKSRSENFVLIANDLILPFSVKKQIYKPTKEDSNYTNLLSKYNKYVPKTKTAIIDYIYSENKDIVTKKFLKNNPVEIVAEKLKYEKRDTLEKFLLFYDINNKTTLKSKKIPAERRNELLQESDFLKRFNEIKNSNERTISKLYAYNELKSNIEEELKNINIDRVKWSVEEDGSEYFAVSQTQLFVAREDNMPTDTNILDVFFNKELDMSQYKKNIFQGNEKDYSECTIVKLQKPCIDINEFLYNKQINEFIQNQRDDVKDYQENEQIRMI